jgi:putative transposon-encoded protein
MFCHDLPMKSEAKSIIMMHHLNIYISIDICFNMAKKINLEKQKLLIQDEIELVFEKIVTKFGTSAKIDCPKKYIGKKVYVMVQKD